MVFEIRRSFLRHFAAFAAGFLLAGSCARSQVSGTTDVNVSQRAGNQSECSISQNPANPLQLFAVCNTSGPGLFAATSLDGGANWDYPDPNDKTIADGDANQGPPGCCDPSSAWDTFGNLFLAYIGQSRSSIVVALSTDGGKKFSKLKEFPGSVDQPTVVAANTSAPDAPVAVWVVWNQGEDPNQPRDQKKGGEKTDKIDQMVATGAAVTGLGASAIGSFHEIQKIPGTERCSFGDVAIAPTGAVVQACENPSGGQGPGATIFVNTDADGLGPGNFGAPVSAATTNVGGIDFIPAQNTMSVDAEAGLAFDNKSGSPHFGRLYLVYTEETPDESADLDILLRFSDDNGGTWRPSQPIRVSDDSSVPGRSQFLPRIAVDDSSGSISVCWHDCRKSDTNTAMEVFCTAASSAGDPPAFLPNVAISDGASTSPGGWEFGDYSGLDYWNGVAHPIWADRSNGKSNFEATTDRVTEGVKPPRKQLKKSAGGKQLKKSARRVLH